MLFDQDGGKTWEETIERVLARMPGYRARVEAVAEATGHSVQEVVEECANRYFDDLEDPVKRAAERALLARRETPFGKDPLLRKDREP